MTKATNHRSVSYMCKYIINTLKKGIALHFYIAEITFG